MVLNCHRERRFLLERQPHLTSWLPIAVPLTSWIVWPPPFGFPPAVLGALGLFPLFFKFVSAFFVSLIACFFLYTLHTSSCNMCSSYYVCINMCICITLSVRLSERVFLPALPHYDICQSQEEISAAFPRRRLHKVLLCFL